MKSGFAGTSQMGTAVAAGATSANHDKHGRFQLHHLADVAFSSTRLAMASVFREAHVVCRAIPGMAEDVSGWEAEGARNGANGGSCASGGSGGGGGTGGGIIRSVDFELVLVEPTNSSWVGGNSVERVDQPDKHLDTWHNLGKTRGVNCGAVKPAPTSVATSMAIIASSAFNKEQEKDGEKKPRRGLLGLGSLLSVLRRKRSATSSSVAAQEVKTPEVVGGREVEEVPWQKRVLDVQENYDYGATPLEEWRRRSRHGRGLLMTANYTISDMQGGGRESAFVSGNVYHRPSSAENIDVEGGSGTVRGAGLNEEGSGMDRNGTSQFDGANIAVRGGGRGGEGGGGGGGQTKVGTKKVLKYTKKRKVTMTSSTSPSPSLDGGSEMSNEEGGGEPNVNGFENPPVGYVDHDDDRVFHKREAVENDRSAPMEDLPSLSRVVFTHHHSRRMALPSGVPGKRILRAMNGSSGGMEKNGVMNMVSFLAKVAMLAMVKRGAYPRMWVAFQGICLSNLTFLNWLPWFRPLHRALEPFHIFTRPMLVLSIATMLREWDEEDNTYLNNIQIPSESAAVLVPSPSSSVLPLSGPSEELVELQEKVDMVKDQLQAEGVHLPSRFDDREIARFLVGAHGSVGDCTVRMRSVSVWHANYRFFSESELLTWAQYISWHGRDMFGRPCLVLRLGHACRILTRRQREDFVQALVSQTEYGVSRLLRDNEAEQFTIIMDCEGIGPFSVPLKLIKSAALMLQQNFPTRLAEFNLINLQMLLRSLLTSIKLVLGERTARKIKVAGSDALPLLEECFGGITNVPSALGGSCECQHCLQGQPQVEPVMLCNEEDKAIGESEEGDGEVVTRNSEESYAGVEDGNGASLVRGRKMFQSLLQRVRGVGMGEIARVAAVAHASLEDTQGDDRGESRALSEGLAVASGVLARDQSFVNGAGASGVDRSTASSFDLATWIQQAPPQLVLRMLVTAVFMLFMLSSLGNSEPWRNLIPSSKPFYM